MGPSSLEPHELFHYSSSHQVLICTQCRYAIQPAAIPRHLKDIHHIYRGSRRPYIAYASGLALKKPSDVVPPTPAQFPVDHLPMERGWRCEAKDCDYLCVSTKRMENHWSMDHGSKGKEGRDWTAAPLQTFFRGTMLRYFTSKPKSRTTTAPQTQIEEVTELKKGPGICGKLRGKYQLDSMDSKILDHYFASTFRSFMLSSDELGPIWLNAVPEIACAHPFILQGILACTALHMAYNDPKNRERYTLRAYAHQDAALPAYRFAIQHPSEDNCDAIITFAFLLAVYTFATEADNFDTPLFLVGGTASSPFEDDSGETLILPRWLYFLRAGCVMLCDVWEKITAGPVSLLALAWEVEVENELSTHCALPHLDFFLSIIPNDSSWSEDSISLYRHAAIALAKSFAYVDRANKQSDFSTWKILGVWAIHVDDGYVRLLSEKHPGALILLAHYCVILRYIDGLWYFRGRPAKLIQSIYNVLDEAWRPFIQEPLREVLGDRLESREL